jgi:aminoglycoside 3-N-acetyltransferase I
MNTLHCQRLLATDLKLAHHTLALMAEVFEDSYEPSDDRLTKLLHRPDFWLFAALDGGEAVGGLSAYVLSLPRNPNPELFIYDLAVHEDHQRRGIGRRLMAAVLDMATATGIEVAFVPADNEDEHALEFYRAIGGEAQPVTFFNFTLNPS